MFVQEEQWQKLVTVTSGWSFSFCLAVLSFFDSLGADQAAMQRDAVTPAGRALVSWQEAALGENPKRAQILGDVLVKMIQT